MVICLDINRHRRCGWGKLLIKHFTHNRSVLILPGEDANGVGAEAPHCHDAPMAEGTPRVPSRARTRRLLRLGGPAPFGGVTVLPDARSCGPGGRGRPAL